METLTLKVFNRKTGKTESIRAFLDKGSQISVISTSCAEKCGLTTKETEPVLLSTFGNSVTKRNLKITSMDFFQNFEQMTGKITVNAFVMNKLVDPIRSYQLSSRQKNYLEANNYTLADESAGKDGMLKIDVLLGQDCVHHFNKGEAIFLPGGSVISPTWGNKYLLGGPVDEDFCPTDGQIFESPRFLIVNSVTSSLGGLRNMGFPKKMSNLIKNVYSCITSEEELEIIDSFRNFELLGISPLDYTISPVLEAFNETTIFDGERYVVRLPFKDPQIRKLSNNFFQAFSTTYEWS